MKKIKKTLLFSFVILLLTSTKTFASLNETIVQSGNETYKVRETPILLDNQLVQTTPKSFIHIKDSYTMVPIRFISDTIDGTIIWDQKNKKMELIHQNKKIEMAIGSNEYRVNGVNMVLEKEIRPMFVNGNTMIPLKVVSEVLGYKVSYDENLKIPRIHLKNQTYFEDLSQAKDTNKVRLIKNSFEKGKDTILIETSKPVEIKESQLDSPRRMVVDLLDCSISKSYGDYKSDIEGIEKIRFSQFDGKQIYGDRQVVRIVLDLKGNVDFKVDKNKNNLNILPKSISTSDKGKDVLKDNIDISYKKNGNNLNINIKNIGSYDYLYNKNTKKIEIVATGNKTNIYRDVKNPVPCVKSIVSKPVGENYNIDILLDKDMNIVSEKLGNDLNISLIEK